MARMVRICSLLAVALGVAPPAMMPPPMKPAALPSRGSMLQHGSNVGMLAAPAANAGSIGQLAPRLRGQSHTLPAHANGKNAESKLPEKIMTIPPTQKFPETTEARIRRYLASQISYAQTAAITERAGSLGALFIAAVVLAVAGKWCRQQAQYVTSTESATELTALSLARLHSDRREFAVTASAGGVERFVGCMLPVARSTTRIARAARGGETIGTGLQIDDKVLAMCSEDQEWYPGRITANNGDATYLVRWDDPDGGPETESVALSNIEQIVIFKDYVLGDDVQAMSPDDEIWYPGVVTKVNSDGTFQVKWDEPDDGPATIDDANPEFMKKVYVFKDYQVDDYVEAKFPDDGHEYGAVVVAKNEDGSFRVKWDDPDGGPENSDVSYKDMNYPRIKVDDLHVGQKHRGVIKVVKDFGAFVDINCESQGLLHISKISENRVDDIHEHLKEEQPVDVWVSNVREDGKFNLTMVEGKTDAGRSAPPNLESFAEMDPNEFVEGVVREVRSFGAFVTITSNDGTEASGLVHISQIRNGFVENIEDELEVGQEVKVRVVEVDQTLSRMQLSMRAEGDDRKPVDLSSFEAIGTDQWLDGKVSKILDFGALVSVKAPDSDSYGTGLVHVSTIREGFVDSVEDELQVGQDVRVRMRDVDVMNGTMRFTMLEDDYGEWGETQEEDEAEEEAEETMDEEEEEAEEEAEVEEPVSSADHDGPEARSLPPLPASPPPLPPLPSTAPPPPPPPPQDETITVEELSKLTVVKLKDKLRQKGLPASGNKAVLIERIMSNL